MFSFLIALGIVLLILWGFIRLVIEVFKPDPMTEDICAFGNWKMRHGFRGYYSPETERKLRRMYDADRND